MKRLERGHKLKARNNGPVYTSMHKGIQSDRIFPRAKEHREVSCLSTNEFFEKIRNYYYYNFNYLLTLFGENIFCSFYYTCARMNMQCLPLVRNGCDMH